MATGEFDIIRTYFTRAVKHPDVIPLSIGDDAAIVRTPAGCENVIAIDTLNAGIHFPHDTPAYDIGWKALAVNLSDLAAMGALPRWFTLALSLPQADEQWLAEFARGLFALADQYEVDLIGGDTTRGPLSIAVQIGGIVKQGQYLTRRGAQVGDRIYVSGTLGDAALALTLLKQNLNAPASLIQRLNQPEPRLALGQLLVGKASACIDISDGLAADLGHILTQSQVGAVLHTEALPRSAELVNTEPDIPRQLNYILHGGDDYELCFTVPPHHIAAVEQGARQQQISISAIGEIVAEQGITVIDANGKAKPLAAQGYQHF